MSKAMMRRYTYHQQPRNSLIVCDTLITTSIHTHTSIHNTYHNHISRHTQPHRSLRLHNLPTILLRHATRHQFRKVQSNLLQHTRMLLREIQTLVPRGVVALHTTQLPLQDDVEVVNMFLGPLDTGRHQRVRKARLERGDGVLDDEEVDVGDLEDVVGEIAFECALPVSD